MLMCRYCVRMIHEWTGMPVLSCAECVNACWIAAWVMQVEQTDGRSLQGNSIQFLCTATGCMPFGAGLASGMEPLLPWYPSWHCLSMAHDRAG